MDKRTEINRVVKESICEALIYYMGRKPFQDITITELIKKAGVARATYYRNFASKEDVAREYLSNVVKELSATDFTTSAIDSYERILKSWQYIERYKDILILYNNAGLSTLLIDSLSDLTFYSFDRNKFKELDDMYFAAFIGALYSVVRKWIIDGAKGTAEDMAKKFESIWHHVNK